jgi:uncharacterized membrane protein affecting hemolysin expression
VSSPVLTQLSSPTLIVVSSEGQPTSLSPTVDQILAAGSTERSSFDTSQVLSPIRASWSPEMFFPVTGDMFECKKEFKSYDCTFTQIYSKVYTELVFALFLAKYL